MKHILTLAFVLAATVLTASVVVADVPQMINYQGRLTDSEGVPVGDGDYVVTFRIYDDSAIGATMFWDEEDTVTTGQGLFSVILGRNDPIPDTLFGGAIAYLGIQLAGQGEIYPRTTLITVPYAYRAVHSDKAGFATSVANDAITNTQILNGTILFEDVGQNGADSGQVMKWDGANWAASNDDVGAGNGWVDDGSVVRLEDTTDFVGIGTTTPTHKLHVSGDFSASTVNTGQGDFEVYAMNQGVRTTDNPTFNRVDLTDFGTASGGFHVGGTSDPGTNNLIVDGIVGIGTTSPSEKLDVNGAVSLNRSSGNDLLYLYKHSNTLRFSTYVLGDGTEWRVARYTDGGVFNGAPIRVTREHGTVVMDNGTLVVSAGDNRVGIGTNSPDYTLEVYGTIGGSGGLYHSSDSRFKKNVSPISNGLAAVCELTGVGFDWRTSEYPERNFAEDRQVGFIAQEVEKVLPQVVSQGSDGYYSVDYGRVAPLLVEAIKELSAENDAKGARIETLEAHLTELTALVKTLLAQQNGPDKPMAEFGMNK